MNEYNPSKELTDEQLWDILHLEEDLYSKGKFTKSQIEGIIMAEQAKLLSGKNHEPFDCKVRVTRWNPWTKAIGAAMLAGLIYAASALYGRCQDPNDSRIIQGSRDTTIEQLIKD